MKRIFAQKWICIVTTTIVMAISGAAHAEGVPLDDEATPDEIASEAGLPSTAESKALQAQRPDDEGEEPLVIIVDESPQGTNETSQSLRVYLRGELLYNWKVSTGRNKPEVSTSGKHYVTSTPTGMFHISRMELDHHSVTWNADMPHAMFFEGGVAIHATTPSHFAMLGSRDSGGCVRLLPENATALYELVKSIGQENALIMVHNGDLP